MRWFVFKCVVLEFWPVGDVLLGHINGQCFLLGSETTGVGLLVTQYHIYMLIILKLKIDQLVAELTDWPTHERDSGS